MHRLATRLESWPRMTQIIVAAAKGWSRRSSNIGGLLGLGGGGERLACAHPGRSLGNGLEGPLVFVLSSPDAPIVSSVHPKDGRNTKVGAVSLAQGGEILFDCAHGDNLGQSTLKCKREFWGK